VFEILAEICRGVINVIHFSFYDWTFPEALRSGSGRMNDDGRPRHNRHKKFDRRRMPNSPWLMIANFAHHESLSRNTEAGALRA
jgi:hypothetical protein